MPTRKKARKVSDDPNVLRDDWLRVLAELIVTVRVWAEELDWSTRQITKKMTDSRLGRYEAPALLMQKETARVLLEPIARFTPGTDGVVDLYLMPAYEDVAVLYFVEGQWLLQFVFSESPPVATSAAEERCLFTKDSFGRVLDAMVANAS